MAAQRLSQLQRHSLRCLLTQAQRTPEVIGMGHRALVQTLRQDKSNISHSLGTLAPRGLIVIRRTLVSAQEEFAHIRQQFIDPIQHDYEVIRPIVLFAATAAERSRQTGVERTVVGDKARRFVLEGMRGLTDRRAETAGRKGHTYPDAIAGSIVYLKQLYPPIHWRAIARIVQRKFGYKTNHHTLKRFLAPYNTPIQLELGLTTFTTVADAYQARWTVVRMAYESWNKKSIADCLKLSRTHVYTILEAFERDGFAGLEDQRTRPPQHPDNQRTLPLLKEILDIQHEYPRAGRFR